MRARCIKLFDSVQKQFARNLWTRSTPYPITNTKSWKIDTLCFDTNTFQGTKITDINIYEFFTMSRSHGLLLRGMHKDEADCKYNQQMHGLVGRNPASFRSENKEDEMLQHQKGNIKGISTSFTLTAAKSFANGLAKSHEILVFDSNNIPEQERHNQTYDSSVMELSSTGEPIDYSHEAECTVSGIHVSSVVARVDRISMLSWKIECNPLYIDQKLLPEDLKQDYKEVLSSFYNLIQTQSPDPVEMKKYSEKELNFYLKVAEKLNYSEDHKAAVVSFLRGGQDLELFGEEQENQDDTASLTS